MTDHRLRFSARVTDLLAAITVPGLRFEHGHKNGVPFLRVVCDEAKDNVTGLPCSWKGRKWMLSTHMVDGEIINTAFKAVLTAMEHEIRETFLYKGVSIYDPHYDLDKLVELRQRPDALQEKDTPEVKLIMDPSKEPVHPTPKLTPVKRVPMPEPLSAPMTTVCYPAMIVGQMYARDAKSKATHARRRAIKDGLTAGSIEAAHA